MRLSKRMFLIFLIPALFLSACSPGDSQKTDKMMTSTAGNMQQRAVEPQATEQQLQLVGAWQITVMKTEIVNALQGTQDSVQYSGDTLSTGIQETPGEGNVFVLVELNINKAKTGSSKFVWDNVYVADAEGNRFSRMPNDSFLDNYGYQRMKATDLTLGNNEGYICFEIPAEAAQTAVTLNYQADDGSAAFALN